MNDLFTSVIITHSLSVVNLALLLYVANRLTKLERLTAYLKGIIEGQNNRHIHTPVKDA